MNTEIIQKLINSLVTELPWLMGIKDNIQYSEALELASKLIGEKGDHRILLKLVSQSIVDYEKQLAEVILFNAETGEMTSGVPALKVLMQHYGLKAADLREELGVASLVSQILSGQRALTIPHIKNLSQRFKVDPIFFLDLGR